MFAFAKQKPSQLICFLNFLFIRRKPPGEPAAALLLEGIGLSSFSQLAAYRHQLPSNRSGQVFMCNPAATSEMFLRRNNENDSRRAKLKVGFRLLRRRVSGDPDTVIFMARTGPSGILFESGGPIALRRYQSPEFVRPPTNDPGRHGFRVMPSLGGDTGVILRSRV